MDECAAAVINHGQFVQCVAALRAIWGLPFAWLATISVKKALTPPAIGHIFCFDISAIRGLSWGRRRVEGREEAHSGDAVGGFIAAYL